MFLNLRYLLLFLAFATFASAEKRPNIVLILADDMGYADLGITGAKDIPTPNIDKLAKEGVFFSQSYAGGAFCTPTRCSLMSGMYPQRTGNDDLDYLTGPLPKSVNTLADRLNAVGYHTGLIGKWHIGREKGLFPNDRGFDFFYGFHGGGHIYFPTYPAAAEGDYTAPIYRNEEVVPETRYLTDAFGSESAEFIKRQQDSEDPFFLFVSFNAVHTPMEAKPEDLEKFSSIENQWRRAYAAMTYSMDQAVATILNQLEASGFAENTLVIFHNDNGGPTTRNSVNASKNTPYRGSKGETFEGGIRVPTVMRLPGVIKPGQTYDKPVATFDLTATAVELGGGDTAQFDGVNLVPFLTGEKEGVPHEELYWRSRTRSNNYAVLSGQWKYVHSTEGAENPKSKDFTPAKEFLFNLAEDPTESNDLSKKERQIFNELKGKFKVWDREMDRSTRAFGGKIPKVDKSS